MDIQDFVKKKTINHKEYITQKLPATVGLPLAMKTCKVLGNLIKHVPAVMSEKDPEKQQERTLELIGLFLSEINPNELFSLLVEFTDKCTVGGEPINFDIAFNDDWLEPFMVAMFVAQVNMKNFSNATASGIFKKASGLMKTD